MADERKDAKAMLTDAIKKRDELNIFIKVLQEMVGVTDTGQAEATTAKPAERTMGAGFDPLSVVYAGMFFGKSQTQATKLLLEQVRPRPLKTKVIAECLEKGGLKIGGKKPLVNLWGALNRDKDFLLVPKAGWSLTDWHEPSVVSKYRKEAVKETAEDEGENGS